MKNNGVSNKRSKREGWIFTKELAQIIGVAQNTFHGYESGKHDPKSELLSKIAEACNVSVDFLLGRNPLLTQDEKQSEETDVFTSAGRGISESDIDRITKYRSLDQHGQEAVDVILDVEYRRCMEPKPAHDAPAEMDTVYFICPGFLTPMSAGTGEPIGNEYPENYRLKKEPPRGTSYIAPIDGDSMEPTYQTGDKLFIRACTEIRRGQIGVFFMDGKQWVKELGDGVLISHNAKYEPRTFTEDIRCQGLVLGVCDESYFE